MSMVDMVSDITPVALTITAAKSDVVDRQGYNALTFICAILAPGAGTGLHVEEGTKADGTDMVAADGKDILGNADSVSLAAPGAAGDGRMIGYVGAKRYARLTITGAGTISGVYAILGEPALGPTPNPPPNNAQLLAFALEALEAEQGDDPPEPPPPEGGTEPPPAEPAQPQP